MGIPDCNLFSNNFKVKSIIIVYRYITLTTIMHMIFKINNYLNMPFLTDVK